MKMAPIAIIAILVWASLLPIALSTPSFEGGQVEVIANLAAPGFAATVNIEIPAEYFATNAVLNVTGMASAGNSSAYPEGVQLLVDGSLVWAFNNTGYGPLGRQNEFSTGSNEAKTTFGSGGGANKIFLRLPSKAHVQTATMDVNGIKGESKLVELANFTGNASEDWFGASLSDLGDVNGDGYDDIIIGCNGGGTGPGHAYIHFGRPAINNTPDLTLTGEGSGDYFGTVSGAGDVNGDGYADVLVGADHNKTGGSYSGKGYLYFGGQNMDNTVDLTFTDSSTQFAWGISGAGDVNNDGYDDIIIGAVGRAKAHVYFGGQNMDNTSDVTLSGETISDAYAGPYRVSTAGDVNNDGFDDIIVGAVFNDQGGAEAGRAYIYYGGINMDSVADVIFTGAAVDDYLGMVSNAGDVNNDGYDDVIVGAPGNDAGGNSAGRAYLFFGGLNMDNVADVFFTGAAANDGLGSPVSDAGDINGDGFDDVVVAATSNDAGGIDSGRAYVYYGGSPMNNNADIIFTGAAAGDLLGRASYAGDVNNDGTAELLVSAPQNDEAGTNYGKAYLYEMTPSTPGALDPSIKLGSNVVWNSTGYFNSTMATGEFSQSLNACLQSATPSGIDASGNSYTDIPLVASAKSGGGLFLTNLSIVYQFTATTPNFSTALDDYLAGHQTDKDADGNITVPVTLLSQSAGRIRLSGLGFIRDLPPSLVTPIGQLELDEDTAIVPFLDLYDWFRDDSGPNTTLDFSIASSTNSTQVRLWITGKRYLSVDTMTGDANDNWTGTVEAVVACTDRWNQKTESNQFTIVVRNVNDPPEMTSTPQSRAEAGVQYEYNITSVDGDNDNLRYNMTVSPTGMTIDHALGKIRWMPVARGIFNVTVTADDGYAQAEQSFKITVPNKNPKITSSPTLNATVGVPYAYNMTAEDSNQDTLAFSLASSPDGMKIESTTGVISWTPIIAGNFAVSVKVSDNIGKAYQNFTIKVKPATDINHMPQFKSTPVTTAVVNIPYIYNASAADQDQDTLTFSLESSPTDMILDSATGKITWTPSVAGNFSVVLKVLDARGGEAKQEFTISVSQIIKPQVFLVSPQTGQSIKGILKFSGTATSGTRAIIQVEIRFDGNEWKDAVGTEIWTYTLNTKSLKNGKHTFEFRAYDGREYSDTVTAELKVDNPSPATKGFIPMMDGLMALALLAVASTVEVLRRRK